MTDWIANFTQSGAQDKTLMPREARSLLDAGLWGIPEKAQAKSKLAAGDRLIVYIGAPDRIFLGDARIVSPWHDWTAAEAAVYPGTFGRGIALSDCRIWDKPVALQPAWSQTQGAATNPTAL